LNAFQPLGSLSEEQLEKIAELFSDNVMPWYNDGRWGLAGYALPACGGKTWTNNDEIYQVHKELGLNMFDLMHREDVKFSREPTKEWMWDLNRLLTVSRKRLLDRRTEQGDPKRRASVKALAAHQTFLVYPTPFHGDRVAQEDIKAWCGLALKMLSDMMMHTGNEYESYVPAPFVDMCIDYIDEIQERMATKYFGYTIDEINAMQFPSGGGGQATSPVTLPIVISAEKWAAYTGENILLNTERTSERPPQRWWPTARDLSAIKGIAITDAMHFADRWPQSAGLYEADWETRLPGLIDRVRRDQPEKADSTVDFDRVGGSESTVSSFDPTAPNAPQ
jgi:hypothetical protein